MSEPSEPLVVPDELAARVRAVGEERKTTTEETLAQLLALVLDVVEHPPRSGRWFLSIVDTDDGPTLSMLIEISSEVLTKIPQPEVPGRGGTAVDMALRRGRSLDDAARRPHLHRCHDRRGRFRG